MECADGVTMGIVGGGDKSGNRGKHILSGFSKGADNAEKAGILINNEDCLCVSTD